MISLEERRKYMINDMMDMVVNRNYQLKVELIDNSEVYVFWKPEISTTRICRVNNGKTITDGLYSVAKFLEENAKVQDWEVY